MANDDFFTVTDEWQVVQAEGVDVENKTINVFSLGSNRVDFFRSEVLPTSEIGPAFFGNPEGAFQYTLSGDEKLYAKVGVTDQTVEIGVIAV